MSIYKTWDSERIDNLLSNYLISSWSYSKVSQFARHEKAFEMSYIYRLKSKSSTTTIAGQAYHYALDRYFTGRKSGNDLDIVSLEAIAYTYIDEVPVPFWKCQKTTPTVQDCKEKALKSVNALLTNFFGEIGTYLDEIKEIIEVEVYCDEWLTVNGVDIPMPCHMRVDLVVLTIHDKIAVIDHKSKTAFSDEEELKLSIGIQAIVYTKGYESKSGLDVDEVWFVENKIAQNKDKSKQLNCFKVTMSTDTRRLYEAILYSPLRRMLQAVSDPDYDYIINESDNFVDKAEIYEFWAKTMVAEVEDFPIDPTKKELVEKRLKKIRDVSISTINPKIIKEFQKNASQFIQYDLSNKDMTQEQKIEHVLRTFGVIVSVAYTFDGYSSNTYLLDVSAGVKITSILSHRLDIANALDVSAVRLSESLVVHENKSYVSCEFSKKRTRDLFFDVAALDGVKIPLGKDNYGNIIIWDLDSQSTPFFLVCGAAGSGKSVFIRSCVEYAKHAGIDNIEILDPKYEYLDYKNTTVPVYNEILSIEERVADLAKEMNSLIREGKKKTKLIFFDEFADALAASRKGGDLDLKDMVEVGTYANGMPKMALKKTGELKSLEENLRILLQKSRSVGFRIMCATQRASVKIMSGDLKVNFSAQVCFRVPKETDSRVVLDEPGAEGLAGMGDGLLKSPEYKDMVRFQAFYKPVNQLQTA